ncbi:MAG TPA: beta-propeller fold lactonase family protein, partial [Terriglobales bacterium]|nr:beta-propeller fold lactonase family protein [Terriglobales bacterium]
SAFAVDTNGAITTVGGSPFAAGPGAEFMAFDSVHKLLLVNNQTANSLSAFSVNTSTGMLSPIAGSPFATGSRPTAVAVDPMGRFVFVANQASGSIGVFSIGANGTLTQVTGSPFAASSPYGLSVNPTGTILYATNFPDSQISDLNTVSAFAIGASGSLSPVAGSPFPDANSSSGFASGIGILADPSGKFVFVGDHMAESVVGFSVNASGALAPLAALPTPAPSCGSSCHNNPLRLAVDTADKFLFSTNVQAGTLSIFGITAGNLASLGQATTGAHPFGVAVDPRGKFVYVVNKSDASISGFQLNSMTGALAPLTGFPVMEGQQAPTDIVIVPKM